jgi:hydrogenase/urease accessory protein HupE
MSAARSLIVLALIIAPDIAAAHAPFDGAGGFLGGLLHPLFVPVHALAILAMGILLARQVPRERWMFRIAFALGLTAGFATIASAYVPTYARETLLALTLVIGALVAMEFSLPPVGASLLAAATGAALALDSPPVAISVREAIVIQLGTFCGATLLIMAVIEVTSRLRRHWQQIGVRILGSWIVASAILVLALHFAR